MKAIAKKQISWKEYHLSLKGKTIHAVWDSHDVLPGLIFPLLLPMIAKKRR